MINENRLVSTFCEMVQIDSPSGEEHEFSKYISKKLSNLGFSVEHDFHGNLGFYMKSMILLEILILYPFHDFHKNLGFPGNHDWHGNHAFAWTQ